MPAKIIDFDLDLDHVRLPGIDFYPKLQQLYFDLKNCSSRFCFFFSGQVQIASCGSLTSIKECAACFILAGPKPSCSSFIFVLG